MSYVLTKNKHPVGYYDTLPETVQALETERVKEDGVELMIMEEHDESKA